MPFPLIDDRKLPLHMRPIIRKQLAYDRSRVINVLWQLHHSALHVRSLARLNRKCPLFPSGKVSQTKRTVHPRLYAYEQPRIPSQPRNYGEQLEVFLGLQAVSQSHSLGSLDWCETRSEKHITFQEIVVVMALDVTDGVRVVLVKPASTLCIRQRYRSCLF